MKDTAPGTFRDPGLPWSDRIDDLLGRLTTAEKIGLLHQHQAPVPRLGLGPFRTGTEALHGVAWLGPATVFPQAVGLGSTWDPDLVRRVGAAVGDEVRGLHHKDPDRTGLNVWAPVVNPLRDPRWGRNEEGYAEDPWLTGLIGTAYAAGLRGDHPRYLRTAPTLKHFLGYNNETDRHRTSSDLPPRVLHEYELPAFRAPLEAGAAVAVMASYNLVNGRPAHLSPLLAAQLRGWAADDVLVVGDAGAVTTIAGDQRYLPDHATGFGAALRAGVDCFTEDGPDPEPTVARLTEALDRGLIDESDVDAAARHVLAVRFRLGEFDPAGANPYAATTVDVVNCTAHQDLAREAARAGVVLLKNDAGLLPLTGTGTVAVLGPLADTVLTDWYSGTLPYAISLRDGLTARLGPDAVRFAEGADRVRLRTAGGVVTSGGGPDGTALRLGPDAGVPLERSSGTPASDGGTAAEFDVLDWGGGTVTLRAAANRRYVRADEKGVLVSDRPGPGEWIVRETFEPVRRGEQILLRHVADDRYVTVGYDGVLRADALDAEEADAFTVDLVNDGLEAAAAVARDADVALVVLGNHPMVGGRETEDRAGLALPPAQEALLRAVRAANPRTALLVTSSYPYAIGWAQDHLPAVLWSAHPGQEGGTALTDVLLGRTADGRPAEPTGRLPQTWYRDAADLPDLLDYDIIGSDATYLYFRGDPLYPFGHGLGYTRFAHRNLRLDADEVAPDGRVEISVDVLNVGDRPGTEVVQFYTRQRRSRIKQPLRRLRGFRRVRLEPGEQRTVTLTLTVADLACHDVTRDRMVVEAARHTVLVGRSCTDLTAATTLGVRGEEIPLRDALAAPLRAADRDDEYGTRLVDAGPRHGDAVAARQDAAWLVFGDVDFGGGATRVTARVSAPAGGARIEVRLDEPFSGPVAATLEVPATGDRHAWADVTAPVTGAAGVHDVYLILGTAGARVASVGFRNGA
ncbi:glycoside hydrolase family 3 C-terminal domain-containing protein [Jidongwangia harbinensis]|uniref:glycoside hydrolase family 3 C-terminal domain-containing protein n=1 Tax=Jidongwangia harbinensis TaxID=2878561 RepID=UPI001CDA00A5|nr:glycoside hydrolase family 3 protein [Jidongwangia harbinensis]MCA2213137.1 glycoside hydrolase family 3 C-terminal domain-containing protein [Jidongwangia harbinensis]